MPFSLPICQNNKQFNIYQIQPQKTKNHQKQIQNQCKDHQNTVQFFKKLNSQNNSIQQLKKYIQSDEQDPKNPSQQQKTLKYTSKQLFIQYLNFFNINPPYRADQNTKSMQNSKTKQKIKTQLNEKQKNILKSQKQKKSQKSQKSSIYKNSNESQQQIIKLVKDSQSRNLILKNKTHKKIIQSGIFIECQNFTNQLEIISVQPSKNSEIVVLQVQMLVYKLKISILNRVQQSFFHQLNIPKCSGSFGTVYIQKHEQKNYAIKCIKIQNDISNKEDSHMWIQINKILKVIKQYFFLKLFQVLQIGPKIDKIFGFDIVLTRKCAQFSMEVCRKSMDSLNKQSSQLKNCLEIMHSLNIVHRDIKPTNIMFSPSLQKNICIDFGGSQVLNQPVGYQTKSQFYGTVGFVYFQVVNIMRQNNSYVDLYFNDYYGLKLTLKEMQNKNYPSLQIVNFYLSQDQSYEISSQKQINQNIEFVQFQYKIYFKHSLKQTQEEDYDLTKPYLFNCQLFKFKLLNFFYQLQPSEINKKLFLSYFQYDNQKYKSLDFQILQLIYSNRQNFALYDMKSFPQKEKQFNHQINLFKMFTFTNNNLPQRLLLVDVEKILLKRQNIQNFIFNRKIVKSISSKLSQKQYFALYAFIMLNYCTFDRNKYHVDKNQKIIALSIFFNTANTYSYIKQVKDLNVSFKVSQSQLVLFVKFFQYFVFNAWHNLTTFFKFQSMRMGVASLMLLGYPANLLNAKSYLLDNFISSQQSRLDRILYFWIIYLICISYSPIMYSKHKKSFFIQIDSNLTEQNQQKLNHLMKPKSLKQVGSKQQQDLSQFYLVNNKLYEDCYQNFLLFDCDKYQEWQDILSDKKLQINLCSKISTNKVLKWKYYARLLVNLLHYKVVPVNQNHLTRQNVPLQQKDPSILPLYNITHLANYYKAKLTSFFPGFLQSFDLIVNQSLISERYSIAQRLTLAIKKKQMSRVLSLIKIITQSSSIFNQFYIGTICNMLEILKHLFMGYFQQLKQKMNQMLPLLKVFAKLIHLADDYAFYYSVEGFFQIFKQIQQQKTCENVQKSQIKMKKEQIQGAQFIYCVIKLTKNIYQAIDIIRSIFQEISDNFMHEFYKTSEKLLIQKEISQFIQITNKRSNSGIQKTQIQSDGQQSQLAINNQNNENECNEIKLFSSLEICLNTLSKKSKKYQNNIKSTLQYKRFFQINRVFRKDIANLEIQEDYGQPNFQKIVDIVETNFNLENKIKNGQIQATDIFPQILPQYELVFAYLVAKINVQNHGDIYYEFLIQFYNLIKYSEFNCMLRVNDLQNPYIFNGLIYLNKSMDIMEEFFVLASKQFKRNPVKENILGFSTLFQERFICQCKKCIPKEVKDWKNIYLFEWMVKKIHQRNVKEECYMAIIFIHCLSNREIKTQSARKLLIFIWKALEYICNCGKNIIMSLIYRAKLQNFSIISNQQVDSIKTQNEIKKQFYLKKKILIYQISACGVNQLVEYRISLHKKFKNYKKLPQLIENQIRKKLNRYHTTKQNYSNGEEIKHQFMKL